MTEPAPPAVLRRRARTVLNRLRKRYGELLPPRRSDPLEELVLTVLSQHTSDVNAERAFESLRAAFPTWEDVVRAPTRAVADAIRSGGLADTKAPRIQAILREVAERRGAFDLSYLAELSDDEARAELDVAPGRRPEDGGGRAVLLAGTRRDARGHARAPGDEAARTGAPEGLRGASGPDPARAGAGGAPDAAPRGA